ncbi:hypothetical protein GCM10022226_78800 [Sphaerisporangium flaviroseum]|uniref:Peptidase M48 domain-containing protein n=1 Tax=Sphaerisporangium flaviroseum TaxID=509199 RepID=A0ABP7JFN7_9ACTN
MSIRIKRSSEEQASKAQPQKFRDAMNQWLTSQALAGKYPGRVVLARTAIAGVLLGAGVLLRVVTNVSLPVSLALGGGALLGAGLWLRRHVRGTLGPVDWDTAPLHWETSRMRMPETNADLIDRLISDTMSRYPSIEGIHPCNPWCYKTDGGPCEHPYCLTVGVLWVGSRRVMVVHHRTADLPAPTLEALLHHEMRHATGVMSIYATAQVTLGLVGYAVAGFVALPVLVTVPLMWGITGAIAWVNELICDIASVRRTGLSAALAALNATKIDWAATPWRYKILTCLRMALFPQHPPKWLRDAAVRAAALIA